MILTPPPYDPQSSVTADSDTCQTQATLHAIEMLQGNKQRWSPRALAVLAGIDPRVGGTIQQVVNAINKYGLIPYDLWPDLTDPWTNNDFFTPVPKEILAQANKSYIVSITAPLTYPFLVEIKPAATMAHLVAQFNDTEIFDSYLPSVKPLSTWQPSAIVGKWGILLKPKYMTFGYKVSNPVKPGDQTVYVQLGNSLAPMTNWQAFLNIGGSENSIVSITQQQLDASSVVFSDMILPNA